MRRFFAATSPYLTWAVLASLGSMITSTALTSDDPRIFHQLVHPSGETSPVQQTGSSSGLYKTELVHRQGPWPNMQDLKMATLRWVDWFNNRRLFGPIGNILPADAEENFYEQRDVLDMGA